MAKHPAGLGRHRTSRHGAPSKRAAKAEPRRQREQQRDDREVVEALTRLEAKLDQLLAAAAERPRRGWRR